MSSYATRRHLTPEEKNLFPGYSDILAHLLFHRGIVDKASAERFLAPDYARDTHDPFLLKGVPEAADRIIRAMKAGEKIAIYADYDADGIPGAAMWHDFFVRVGFTDFTIYIPHRHNEGFGLNESAVDKLADGGTGLIVTVDCGISDATAAARANGKGMEVIVTDHHEAPPELPPVFAIVDPKQPGCGYPDKNLCGTGVAWKLIQAILVRDRFGLPEGQEKWLLDLVGMATLSDMVPLSGENRALAKYGLAVLRKSQRKGLKILFERLRISQKDVTEDDIAFMITPRINASSRMGVPMDAFRLLTAADEAAAAAAADRLENTNAERKGAVAALVKEIKRIVRDRHGEGLPPVIVLGDPSWRPSLLGLAASSCAEEFRRPVFLWGRDGGDVLKGSCRSEGSTHVVELMRAVPSGVFAQFGGHRHSGGFTVNPEAVHFLAARLNEAASKLLADAVQICHDAGAADIVDAELRLDDVDDRLADDLVLLSPFGVGNHKPLFAFKNAVPELVRRFGKGNEHVELVFRKSDGMKIPAIAFFGAAEPWADRVRVGRPVDLIASAERSYFRNRPELRLRIDDVVV